MTHAFDVLDFGACPDGKTLNTQAIQQAVNACHEAGGGRVVCGPGAFLTGALELKSGVELHLAPGCRLVGSPRLEDYAPLQADGFRSEFGPEKSAHGLLWAANAENVAITGAGTVDGSGLAFYDLTETSGKLQKPPTPRPRIGMFYQCRRLRIQDVSLVDSPCWTLWLMQCDGVHVHRVSISGNRRMRNVDGIDIDACRNVTVSDCIMDTEDDCIVLRAIQRLYDAPATTENVVVSNCVLSSGCQGVRVGCPRDGTIRNCSFTNLTIRSEGNGIIVDNLHRYLPSGEQGTADVSNLLFSNVVVECRRVPIKVFVEDGIALKRLSDLSFSDFRIRSGGPCVVQGSPETLVENIRFSNMKIETSGEDAIVCRHCRGVHFSNVELCNRGENG